MKARALLVALAALAVAVAVPRSGRADHDHDNDKNAPQDVVVEFGAPQPQTVPNSPATHVLVPDDADVRKGGTVTFVVNGGGHGMGTLRSGAVAPSRMHCEPLKRTRSPISRSFGHA